MRLLAILTGLLASLTSPALALELPGTCLVHFIGSSTLHDFAGEGPCEPFTLQVESVPTEGLVVSETTLTVAIAGIHTGNSTRDGKMREMFGNSHYPLISGLIDRAPLATLRRQLHEAAQGRRAFPFLLRIRTIDVPVEARVTHLVDDDKALGFNLEFPVSLSSFQLEAPSVLGLIRVADEVQVTVTVALRPLPSPWLQ